MLYNFETDSVEHDPTMYNFLKESRKLLNITENICIIFGNESCDLDSAVSSIALAYYYTQNKNKIPSDRKFQGVLPIFNIPRQDFPLKTEVVHFLRQNKIDTDVLTFKDDVDENFVRKNSLVLVDHHVSPYFDSIIGVFDHRPFDYSSKLKTDCEKVINQVGSCSTLIGNLFLQLQSPEKYKEQLQLLHAVIILDTANFSKEADRATELDFEIVERIEKILEIPNPFEHRQKIFDDLIHAKADVSSLNSYQILFKDMKMITNKSGNVIVALPGFPILVQDYIKIEGSEENIKKFAEYQNCAVVLLIGMKLTNNTSTLERDLGLINISKIELYNDIAEKLRNNNTSNLELEDYGNCKFMNGRFFKQNNVKATRKQILPIVKTLLDEL